MSYTRLRYHIVTATKNRDRVISPEIEPILHRALREKGAAQGVKLLQIGGVEDHIHIIAAIPPTRALADFVRELKSSSSRTINESFFLDTRFEWQSGYGAFTLNPNDMGAIVRYVANQKQRHQANELWPAFEKCEGE